jgi:hypothetical protein
VKLPPYGCVLGMNSLQVEPEERYYGRAITFT